MKHKGSIWATSPAGLCRLDTGNPVSLMEEGTIFSSLKEENDMTTCGWIYIGTVDLDFTIEVSPKDLALRGVGELKKRLREKDAEHQKLRNTILEQISRLESLEWNGGSDVS